MGVGKFNRDAWKNSAKERESRSGGFNQSGFAKPGKGVTYWKLLPPWNEETKSPCYDVLLYFGYKRSDGERGVYKGLDKDCPLLSRYIKLKKSEDPKLQAKAATVKPKRMYIYNAVNAVTGELKVLQLTQSVQEQIDEEFEDRGDSFDPFDPKNNWVLKVKRKGTSWNDTKYTAKFVKAESFKLSDDIDLNKLSDLSALYETFTRDELVALTKGEPPKSKRKKKEKGDDDEQEEKQSLKEVDEDEEDESEETIREESEDVSEDSDEDDNEENLDEDSEEEDDEEFEKARRELESDL